MKKPGKLISLALYIIIVILKDYSFYFCVCIVSDLMILKPSLSLFNKNNSKCFIFIEI